MKIVVARFDSGKDFLRHYDPAFETGGLRVPTKAAAAPGEPLALQVSFPGSPSHVLLRSRAVGRDSTQGALVAAFVSSERGKKDYLLACARGEVQAPWMRRHWRFPLQLRVSFGLADQPSKVEAFAEDISKGGMFVRTPITLSARTPVSLCVDPGDGDAPIAVAGEVVWVRHHPLASGFGVRWDDSSGVSMTRLRRLIRGVDARGRVEAPASGAA